MPAEKKVRTYDDYMETIDPVDRERINCKVAIMSKIIEARKQKGLSQQDLASIVGMKQPAIARLENLKTVPTIDTLIEVLHPLGYTLEVVPIKESVLVTATI
jgi:predicted transcriptional regulator